MISVEDDIHHTPSHLTLTWFKKEIIILNMYYTILFINKIIFLFLPDKNVLRLTIDSTDLYDNEVELLV